MLDILFLTEVDSFDHDDSLRILNYKAVVHNKTIKKKTRLLALIHEDIFNDIKVRTDLEIIDYPSVALEIEIKGFKKVVVYGFYRTWSQTQQSDLDEICNIISKICDEGKIFVGLGDVNLDKRRFEESNYRYPVLRDKLLDSLAKNDILMADLPYTYMSKSNGRMSEIDHIYWSSVIDQRVKTYLGESAVSDHYSVIISIDIEKRSKRKIGKEVKFVRSYKNFSQEKFNFDLLNCNWEYLGLTSDVNEMVNLAQSFIKETFEFNVPLCKIKFNDKHISELQQETKELMKKRNKERRLGNVEEYKKLRNKCNKLIKKDRCENINNKITNDPKKGLWRQYNKIVNGRESKQMQLKENGMIIEDNTKISNIMNVFFKEKIVNIKSELPVSNLNPLSRLKII